MTLPSNNHKGLAASAPGAQTGRTEGSSHSAMAGRIYTVPPGRPFLDVLARAMLAGEFGNLDGQRKPGPLALTDITLLLPTRRATRALQDAFLANMEHRAVLLPTIRPISEADEEFSLLAGLAGMTTQSVDNADAIPPIPELERRLVLTQLVLRWAQAMRKAASSHDAAMQTIAAGSETPAQAAHLAGELARLMDMVETEDADLSQISGLVPDAFSQHWQKTLQFLDILMTFWPAHLAERGFSAPAAQRNATILAEARRLREAPPSGPVIVAGVTGSIPATAELMRAVAGLPNGAIVLPNLDLALDEESWDAIRPTTGPAADLENSGRGHAPEPHPEHPQFGLKVLLDRLGITRDDVQILPGAVLNPDERERQAFFSAAMRPAATTAQWHTYAQTIDRDVLTKALQGVSLVDAPNAHDEAEVVALILREALETPGQTAALVSPDRLLARRVATRLESWGIRVDDSAGRPFAKTVPGAFLDLVIEAMHQNFAPTNLTALLKHPLTRLKLGAFEARRAARALELAAFRTDYFGTGLDGVETALEEAKLDVSARERRERAVRRLREEDWAGARDLVQRLKRAYQPLVSIYQRNTPVSLTELATAHVAVAEAIAELPDHSENDIAVSPGDVPDVEAIIADQAPLDAKEAVAEPPLQLKLFQVAEGNEDAEATSPLYSREAGAAASQLFTGLIDPGMPPLDLAPFDYADLYRSLIVGLNVRPRIPVHPRLSIWGPFEARLQQPDIVILGSLNDGTWPEAADAGAWLNRPMRKALGLPSPEEKIGHAAHDFVSLLGAKKVYLTRAEKIDGVPTVPSRWLMRIVALLDGMEMRHAIAMDRPWLGWARARDYIAQRHSISAPQPRPPVALRPRRLSVSAIEQWMANPYAIFARHILGLDPLPRLGKLPDASLKGSVIHDVLAEFARRYPHTLPDHVEHLLVAIAREQLAPYLSNPRIRAFWLPRFERFARWFAETEPQRRCETHRVLAEISGAMVLEAPQGPFTLTARADRIDMTPKGCIITDYKTGQAPNDKRVLAGLAPQLGLEAAIAIAGGFENVEPGPVAALCYIRSTGGTPPGESRMVKTGVVEALAAELMTGLGRLVARFDDAQTPYSALRRSDFTYAFDDFAHLARVSEWSGQQDEAEQD